MFYLAIVNKLLRHCHSCLARQYHLYLAASLKSGVCLPYLLFSPAGPPFGLKYHNFSSLDKQCICVNTQLSSSKRQLKLNVRVPKSNSVYRYAITCNVIAYHLVHFVSICVIYKCQSGIYFVLLASAQYNSNFMDKVDASN